MGGPGRLEEIVGRIREGLARKNAAREEGLADCRSLIRLSANTIRAVHRGEMAEAADMLEKASAVHTRARDALRPHGDIYHAGFLHDAEKEFVEAQTTLAMLSGRGLPSPEDLGVENAAYLNGIAESIGELRRAILDSLRRGQFEGCETLLQAMDDIYAALVTVDFPDAMTGGLRRTTDQARGILERTRGDLTMAIVQRRAYEGDA